MPPGKIGRSAEYVAAIPVVVTGLTVTRARVVAALRSIKQKKGHHAAR